jgi:ABC-type multidrug transport system, permease component
MLNILKNNYLRMFKRLPMTLALILVTLLSMLLGVYVSGQQIKGHIAVVYQKSVAEQLENELSDAQKSIDAAIQEQLTTYDQEKTVAEANALAEVTRIYSGNQLVAAESQAKSEVDSAFDSQISESQITAMREIVQLPILNTLSDATRKLDVLQKLKDLSTSLPNAMDNSQNSIMKTSELENYALIQYANVPKNQETKYLDISVVSEEPPLSSLLLQKYDAYIVIHDGDTNYTIKTLRNNSLKDTVISLIANQSATSVHLGIDRNIGETITGFILMFLLLSIFSMLFTLSDDKEKGMLTRLATTPMKLPAYLAAHMLYAFTTMLPSYIALVILQAKGINIGLTLPQYALVYLCVSVFGIPLALWFITIFQSGDDATLFGNSILILSTVLSGAFFSVNNNNVIFKNFISCLPQKQILNFVDNLHNGTAISHLYPIVYVLVAGIILFGMAIVNLRFQARKA